MRSRPSRAPQLPAYIARFPELSVTLQKNKEMILVSRQTLMRTDQVVRQIGQLLVPYGGLEERADSEFDSW